jgi:transaldolase
MPEATLNALADHGELGSLLAADGGDCEQTIAQFAKAGVNVETVGAHLQTEGAQPFVKSRHELLGVIASKTEALQPPARANRRHFGKLRNAL